MAINFKQFGQVVKDSAGKALDETVKKFVPGGSALSASFKTMQNASKNLKDVNAARNAAQTTKPAIAPTNSGRGSFVSNAQKSAISGVSTNVAKATPTLSTMTPSSFSSAITPNVKSVQQPASLTPPKTPESMAAQAETNAFAQRLNAPDPRALEQSFTKTTPTVDPVREALSKLQEQYTALLSPSAREQELKSQLAQYMGAQSQAIAGLEGQGRNITTGLVRGKQEALTEQANLQAQTLQNEIANEQAAREAQANALGQQLQFAQAEVDRADTLAAQAKTEAQAAEQRAIQFQTSMLSAGYQPLTGGAAQLTRLGLTADDIVEIGGKQFIAPKGTPKVFEVGNALVDEQGNVIYQDTTGGTESKPFTVGAGSSVYDPATGTFITAPGGSSTTPSTTQPSQLTTSAASLIGDLIGHPGLTGALGIRGNFIIPGSQAADFKAQLERLKSLLSLENIQYLKGTGAMSDREFATLSQAAAALDQNMSPEAFTKELQRIQRELSAEVNPQVTQQLDSLLNSGQITQEEYNTLLANPSLLGFNKVGGDTNQASLGSLSQRYESGGDPGAIGYDSTGGYSYGTYQLAHNNAKNFVEQSPFAQMFKGLTFNSKEFQNRWKEVAKQYGDQFKQAQHDYIAKTHFEPQMQKLASAGINVQSLPDVLKDVIWSTAVQHGANTDIVAKAMKSLKQGATLADAIKAIYNERWSGGQRFASSTQAVKNAVYNRFFGKDGELNQALAKLA